jgi:TolB protein
VRDFHPAWSPDGERIAFESLDNGQWDIYVMNSDGSNVRNLMPNTPSNEGNVTWSPDGERIAFVSDRDGDFEIYVMNADGSGEPRNLTRNEASDVFPAWSPSSDELAYRTTRNGYHQLYLLDVEQGISSPLMINNFNDDHPAWSLDGSKIAFTSDRGTVRRTANGNSLEPFDIYVIDVQTKQVQQVTSSDGDDRYPDWNPDPSSFYEEAAP